MDLNKIANTDHPIIDLIKQRWSPRSFSTKQVNAEQINSLLEAARWAPSSSNEQPWKYYYGVKGTEGFEKILSCLSGGNQPWAKNASVLFIAATRKTTEGKGSVNDWAEHDLGLANMLLILQATLMGIYTHPMAGFDKAKTIATLFLDDDIKPICAIAIGYLDDADKLDEPFRSREKVLRTRKSIKEFAKKV